MPGVYDKLGVRFLYPDNWQIVEESLQQAPLQVTLQTPGTGFWSLTAYGADVAPRKLITEALQALKTEYPELEFESRSQHLGPADVIGYDLDFYYLDLLVSAQVYAAEAAGRSFLIYCQAESREFDGLRPVFEAMAACLFAGGQTGLDAPADATSQDAPD